MIDSVNEALPKNNYEEKLCLASDSAFCILKAKNLRIKNMALIKPIILKFSYPYSETAKIEKTDNETIISLTKKDFLTYRKSSPSTGKETISAIIK
jgi:hypothetical protein